MFAHSNIIKDSPSLLNCEATRQRVSDQHLIERLATGDQLAMRALFARHRVRIFRFIFRLIGDEGLAEDVVSEVFLELWRQATSFEARSSVSTWLLAIARNKALSILRRQKNTAIALDDTLASSIADPADNPEESLESKDLNTTLQQSLSVLSPQHGEVIDLIYYQGKTIRETAAIVHIPEATVKTRMFYARKQLSRALQAA